MDRKKRLLLKYIGDSVYCIVACGVGMLGLFNAYDTYKTMNRTAEEYKMLSEQKTKKLSK